MFQPLSGYTFRGPDVIPTRSWFYNAVFPLLRLLLPYLNIRHPANPSSAAPIRRLPLLQNRPRRRI